MEKEMIEKLKEAGSAEEVIAIARGYGRELTPEKAQDICSKVY